MAIAITRLDPNPVKVTKGGITYFDMFGTELLTNGLKFYASFDEPGAQPDEQIRVSIEGSSDNHDNWLRMTATATDSSDNDPQKIRWVVIKLNNNVEDAAQGIKVI